MCRRRNNGNKLGCLVILAGVLIILALVLPPGFWWFALAIALICGGIWLLSTSRSNTCRPCSIDFRETTAGGDRKWNCQ